jgi:predicted nucleic acid-binding protein
MVTTAVDRVFVDTNVLVFATQTSAPWHAEAARALSDLHAAGAELWISRQILREYLAALSRPQTFAAPLPIAILTRNVTQFETLFAVAEDGYGVTIYLLNLLGAISCAGKQVHDANIVATMLAHGIPKLLTHNVADFTRFVGQITVLPLIP